MQRSGVAFTIGLVGWLVGCGGSSTPVGDGGCTTPLCADLCCAPTDSCIQLACCPQAQSCGNACCTTGAICTTDGTGAKKCALLCTTAASCPAATPCCSPVAGGSGMAACVATAAGQQCLCTSGFDCSTTRCCAPATDTSGNPVGPYVCKPNDGANYNCSTDAGACTGSGCRAVDPHGSYICIKPCTSDGQCGTSHCISYTLPSDTTCTITTGCGL